MKKFLVTGGTGFIGSALVKRLLKDGHYVRVLDNNIRGNQTRLKDVMNDIDYIEGDIRNYDVVNLACEDIDVIHHLAYINGTEYFYSMPEVILEIAVKGIMNIIGCLDVPSSGDYELSKNNISKLNSNELATIRNKKIGFIFQSFNLLPRLNALENVMLPLVYSGKPSDERKDLALNALNNVGLKDRTNHRPNELSGGQQQRVSIARAIVGPPKLILADEPTGALDSKTSEEIMAIMKSLNQKGITIVLVTHESDIAGYGNRIIHMKDGKIIKDEK